jgi:mannose-1-phosphate guanylyltransferase
MYVVIPAGGGGTRLWPLSRADRPKFLHPLTGGDRSLIQATVDRLAPLAPSDRTLIVTGGGHAAVVARQLPDVPADHIVVEPAPRDSGPAIGLAAALIHRLDPDAVMGSFASDHLVRDEETFRATIATANEVAERGYLVTVGITPTGPETGYGYIRRGEQLDIPGAYTVGEFKEKPSRDVAEEYVASGLYSWNASMFVWKVSVVMEEMAKQLPELYAGLMRITDDWDTSKREVTMTKVWASLDRVTIDHGIMEGAAARGRVAVVPGDFGWNDVGDWDTLASVLPADENGNVAIGESPADHLAVDTHNTLVAPGSGRLVATLGLRDLVVVDTPDAVLVCPRDRAQDVRAVVDALKARGDRTHI